jgi:hypothetical protein
VREYGSVREMREIRTAMFGMNTCRQKRNTGRTFRIRR